MMRSITLCLTLLSVTSAFSPSNVALSSRQTVRAARLASPQVPSSMLRCAASLGRSIATPALRPSFLPQQRSMDGFALSATTGIDFPVVR